MRASACRGSMRACSCIAEGSVPDIVYLLMAPDRARAVPCSPLLSMKHQQPALRDALKEGNLHVYRNPRSEGSAGSLITPGSLSIDPPHCDLSSQ